MRVPNTPSSANSDFINRFNTTMAKQQNFKAGVTNAANTRRKKAGAQAQLKQVVAAQQKAAKAKNAMPNTQSTPKPQVGRRQMSEQQREQLIMLQRQQADAMAKQRQPLNEFHRASISQKRSASPAPPVPTQRQQVAMDAQQRRNAMTQRSSANMAKGGMMKKKGK